MNLSTEQRAAMIQELQFAAMAQPASKDIILVVHDQLDYVRPCIESIQATTTDYTLWIWDNNSSKSTSNYLQSVRSDPHNRGIVEYRRSEKNLGFIEPCNYLAANSKSPYLIFLNSDTEVGPTWAETMLGFLQHGQAAQVGFMGGLLDAEGKGFGAALGASVDYICGWCFAISRQTYEEFGLFDDWNLEFAYFEDSDFSLRLKEAGKSIYALSLGLVVHFGNKTVVEVTQDPEWRTELTRTFETNHQYFRQRWAAYLANERVLLQPSRAPL